MVLPVAPLRTGRRLFVASRPTAVFMVGPPPFDAFWVHAPFDDPNYPQGLEVAFDWLASAPYTGQRTVVLYAKKMANNSGLRRVNEFHVVSPKSQRPLSRDVGPVLAVWPDPKTIEFAEELAIDSALCVVPNYRHGTTWWIDKTGAVDLTNPAAEPSGLVPMDSAVTDTLDSIIRFGGHNNFVGGGEKEYAVEDLRALLAAGHRPTAQQIEDYVRSTGEVDVEGAQQLAEWSAIIDGRQLRDYRGRSI